MTTWKTYRVRTQSGASENFRHRRNADHFDVGQKAAAVAESLGGPINGARVYMLRPELDGTPSEGTPGYLRPIHGGTAWKVMGADDPDGARVHAQDGQGLGAEGADPVRITLRITDSPSRSKGWARAKLLRGSRPVIASNTGNEWVGGAPTYTGEAPEGAELDLTVEVLLNVGQSRATRREQRTDETHRLTVSPNASTRVVYRPGSQGITVEITGAELAG